MSFAGAWYNELGSRMDLRASGGNLFGTYESAVGYAARQYELRGRYDTLPPSGGALTMAWAVAWQNPYLNSHSATGWSGRYHSRNPATGQEEIYTVWLLASQGTPAEEWASTRIWHDTFTRQPPSEDDAAARRLSRPVPHPPELLDGTDE